MISNKYLINEIVLPETLLVNSAEDAKYESNRSVRNPQGKE
jgi:hypothetical protein